MDPVATHSCHLLQQLHEQRIQGLLCDCMLVVKGVCFKAHKNVLAAFSQYFRSLFQNSSGQKSDVFHLDVKNVSGIGQILDFMYTSHLDLNQDNIRVVLDIAQCLQVQNVLNLCHTFLKSAAVEQPPGVSCNSTFSLQSALAADAHCVGSENYPPPLLQECPAEVQQSKVLDEPHSHAPPSVNLHHPAGDAPKPAPGPLEASGPELPLRHSYCHKLRNFYSKQHYKQAACPGHGRVGEPPFPPSTPTGLGAGERQPGAAGRPGCGPGPAGRLPPRRSAPPLSEPDPDPESDSTRQPLAKQMRLKKAIHLKRLNFLRSRTPAEPASEARREDGVTERAGPAGADAREEAGGPSAEGRGGGGLIGSEHSNCVNDTERPEDPAALEDQSQTLQPQRQYACELCGKPFKHPSNLDLHKRSHTGEKPFECNICGKHFSQAGNLQTHLRRHSGEKPYICEICGKRFAASGDVQRHIIIHSGEKPHLCDICGRGFSNFSNLKEHRKTHTADKVFTCDDCGKSFNMRRKLVKHRVRHTGERPYGCPACGKCFGGSGDLRRHVRTHTGEKPYVCEVCSKCFTRSAVLRRHKRTHCRPEARRDALDELAQALDASDLEKSQGSDAFSQDVPVALMPASLKLPVHPVGESVTEFDGHAAGPYCKFRAAVEPHGAGGPEKLGPDPGKLAKRPLQPAPQQTFAYPDAAASAGDQPLPADSPSLGRSSPAALDTPCGDGPGGRAASTPYRNPEGQFFSSMTLWGLAMKTLQNENELDQ
uniref:Zinc finger and BTB domain-containing protein 49 n=1 Tax=Panthera leo TaxID=9689 RepID=A0A8C8WBX3_PANLE